MTTRDIRAYLREIYGVEVSPDLITRVTWRQAIVQLCVVHLIRASLRYASRKYWAPLAKDLRLIYTAADEAAAAAALEAFAASWESRYLAIERLWRAHWGEFTPFLAFPPEVRRVIYTTNLIESINARLRKVTRNRGQFPSEQAALKVLYLAVRNLEEFRRPNTGIRSPGRKQALQAFTIYSTGESPPHENRHDHLHRRSDAPWRSRRKATPRGGLAVHGIKGCAAVAGLPALCSIIWDDLSMQGKERAGRQLLDARALVRHLVPAGSMFVLLAAHRGELFADEDFTDLFPSGRGRPRRRGVICGGRRRAGSRWIMAGLIRRRCVLAAAGGLRAPAPGQ